MGPIDQLDIIKGNISLKHTIEPHIIGSDIVINFVGILNESSGDQTFDNCHAAGPKNIAELCSEHKIERLIHFSSIGADINSDAKYQVSKGLGEKNILDNFSSSTIIRPSIVFGPGDGFFTFPFIFDSLLITLTKSELIVLKSFLAPDISVSITNFP